MRQNYIIVYSNMYTVTVTSLTSKYRTLSVADILSTMYSDMSAIQGVRFV